MAVMDILIRATDEASSVIQGVASQAEESSEGLQANWVAIGAATAGAGLALEGFARGQADTNAIIAKSSAVTGESEDAIRSTIDALSGWGFGADEVAAGMDELIRRGVNTKEGFESILPVADAFADATGVDVPTAIAQMDSALSALGIPLEEAGDHVDTFTLLSQQSTVPLEQFERQIGKVGPELQKMGMDVDDTAAFLLALEGQGLSGRVALREFASAAEKSEGDIEAMKKELGLTDKELEQYEDQVANSTGITEKFGAANEDQMTWLERVQVSAGNLMTKYGGLAQAAGMLSPILMGLGALIPIVTAAKGAWSAVTGVLSGALSFLAANPIVLIIAAIAALIAIVVLIIKNWDKVKEVALKVWGAITDFISNVVGKVVDFLKEAWDSIWNTIKTVWDKVLTFFKELPGKLLNAIKSLATTVWDFIVKYHPLAIIWRKVQEVWPTVRTWLSELPGKIVDAIKGFISTVGSWIAEHHPIAILFRKVKEAWPAVKEWFAGIPGKIKDAIGDLSRTLFNIGKKIIQGLWDGLKEMWNKVTGWFSGIGDWIADHKGPPSVDAKLLTSNGELIMQGFFKGLQSKWKDVERFISSRGGELDGMLGNGDLALAGAGTLRSGGMGGMSEVAELLRSQNELLRQILAKTGFSIDGRDLVDVIGGPLVSEIRQRTGI